jgi:ankyrin repeat protein
MVVGRRSDLAQLLVQSLEVGQEGDVRRPSESQRRDDVVDLSFDAVHTGAPPPGNDTHHEEQQATHNTSLAANRVQTELSKGADPSCKDDKGYMPLIRADEGYVAIVEALIKSGADVDTIGDYKSHGRQC